MLPPPLNTYYFTLSQYGLRLTFLQHKHVRNFYLQNKILHIVTIHL